MRPKAGKHKSGGGSKGNKGKQTQKEKKRADNEHQSNQEKPFEVRVAPGTSSESVAVSHEEPISQKYAKRHIRSNWDKYEIPAEDDDRNEGAPPTRGANFSAVLDSNLGGGQFRFADEKLWEDETEFTSQIFCLDLQDLADSLSCIPLHQRLEFPTDCLNEKLIKGFEDAAKAKELVYRTRLLQPRTAKSKTTQRDLITKQTMLEEKCDTISEERELDEKGAEIANDLEDELEMLLNLREPRSASESSVSKKDTTHLTEIDVNFPNTSFVGTVNQTVTNKFPVKDLPTQSLEDWLDSVLED